MMGEALEQQVPECECIICGKVKLEGIMVISEFICDDCEAEMVRTDVLDSKYPFFINQLKRIYIRSEMYKQQS
jgi:hypothetical protein